MATKGRGGDSMLVHMTPGEVQALQTLAERSGGSLTINPETGQPEANFLKKILPMVAGFALGPAGFGLMSAGMAGAAVGGITALSTGSLSRGLMAGLGAYGGASLGGSLAGAGEGAIAAGDIAAQQAAGTFPTLAEGAGAEQIAKYATDVGGLRDAALSKAGEAGFGAKMSAGFGQMASNPGAYTREMLTGLAAISPVLADEGVKTATRRPDTGTIRNFTFDPYGQTYSSAGNYPASEYKGMAQGGIVALANGGFTDAQVASYIQNNNLSGQALKDAGDVFGLNADQLGRAQTLLARNDPSIQAASQTYAAQVANRPDLVEQNLGFYNPATQTGSGWEDVATNRYIQDQPGANYAQIAAAKQGAGVTNEDLARSFDRFGYSDALYNVTTSPDWQNELGMTGFAGLSSNINAYVNKANELDMTPAEKRARAYADMTNSGMNMKDVVRATGKTIEELFPDLKKPIVAPAPIITGIPTPEVTTLPGGVSGGGNTVVNPDGTITTAPNIPGRPEGGFTGMGQVRDVYTQGGGSLGYVNPAPKTMEEFDQRFNRQTGDSLAAYEYLMGKGANPIKSGVGEIMRPYSEAVRGVPAAEGRPTQRYIYQDGRYVENPNYRPMSFNSKGERMVGMTSSEVIKGLQGLKDPADDGALFDFVSSNRISEAQLAAALGISIAEARARLAAGKKLADGTAAREAAAAAANDPNAQGGANGGLMGMAAGGYAVGGGLGALAKGGVADLPDGAFVLPARITSEVGNGSTNAGAQKLHAMEQRLLGKNAPSVNLGRYSGGGNLVRGEGDGVSDSVPATIGGRQPARIADGEYIVSREAVKKLGNGSTEAGARKLYAMMDRVQKARGKTTGKNRVAANTRSDKYLPA
jgi:hypothetical protein